MITLPGTSHVQWRKSSRSSGNGQCVEVAGLEERIGVRDSKAPNAGYLAFTPREWSAFLAEAKSGRFDEGTN